MSSLAEENRDLRKHIGCMNGIFQIFDRHHFVTGRRISSHSNKRTLQGVQHPPNQNYATKVAMAKGADVQKEKPRISTESSRASFPSSSCSSTFSLLDFSRTAQPETTATKECQPSPAKGVHSHDLRDLIKDSMYREVRSLCIKPLNSNDERRGTAMKHIDSPRPSQLPVAGKPKNSKDERLPLPRFSCDGRETREIYKLAMKPKELPRLSLDSKTGSIKAVESRLSFCGPGPHDTYQELGIHNRTSSIVAKLMGLDALPDDVSTYEDRTPTIKSCPKEALLQNQVNYCPRVSQKNTASASPESQSNNFARKLSTFSRFPVEPAPWRQQDSPKTVPKNRQASANTRYQTSSVYGEIEKSITELEFKKSGKDLRALKQILEAMPKMRERLEDRRGEPAELTPQRSSNKNRKTYDMKPAKVMDKVVLSVSTRTPKRTNDLTPEDNSVQYYNRHLHNTDKKTFRSSSRAPQNAKSANCTTPGRSSGAVSPRLQQNLLRTEGQSHPTTPSSDNGRVKKQCDKKLVEKGSQTRNIKVKPKDKKSSDEQSSELSSDSRYSSYQGDTASVQSETETISMARSINTSTRQKEHSVLTTREYTPAVESAVVIEQPSPISVLDNRFCCEDSPSPVKKISTIFRDESQNLDEAEWHLETLNHLRYCTRSNGSCEYNQIALLNEEKLDQTAADHNGRLNLDQRYIDKILVMSGLLNDWSFITTTDPSSHRVINPDIFHDLEQTEEIRQIFNGGAVEKNDTMDLNERVQRKIVFDMVDEILVRKINSDRLCTLGKKQTSRQGLTKEVRLEIERVCRVVDGNLDEEDQMIRRLTADIAHESVDWLSYSCQLPALVLDVERHIFKDLINEVVAGEVMDVRDQPKRHCRQLFSM